MVTLTLWEELCNIETADRQAAEASSGLIKLYNHAVQGSSIFNSTPPSAIKVDIGQLQFPTIQKYAKNNLILQQAISGEKTLEQTLDELYEPFKKFGRTVPYKLNKEHNAKVREFSKLIDADHLLMKGCLEMDNVVNNSIGGTAAMSTLFGIWGYVLDLLTGYTGFLTYSMAVFGGFLGTAVLPISIAGGSTSSLNSIKSQTYNRRPKKLSTICLVF